MPVFNEVPSMPGKNDVMRRAYEAARARRRQLKLRFNDDETQSIREAAAGAGQTIADFFLTCVAGQPRPVLDLGQIAQVSAAVTALSDVPKGMSNLEADLGRLSGRLSHLFTLNYERASMHREEIHETLKELRTLMRRVLPEIEKTQTMVAEPRTEITRVMRAIARELGNESGVE
jgi:uncharacterized protein (DUF1778 family)